MYTFRSGAGAVVAGDGQSAVAAFDDALLNGMRLGASIIEAAQGSDLPAAQSQRLLASMTSGLSQVVAGRADLVATLRQLTVIKGRSNFAPEDYGCPEGWPVATAAAEPVGQPA